MIPFKNHWNKPKEKLAIKLESGSQDDKITEIDRNSDFFNNAFKQSQTNKYLIAEDLH